MKNVLLPTDFSENSLNAIKYALRLFEETACNFYLLHVIKSSAIGINDSPYLVSTAQIEDVYTQTAKARLRDTLNHISTKLSTSKKHKFYTVTDHNFLVESIRQQVSEKKINMIVMGTKGATGLKKIIVGSNTGDVITKVHCNTLVVPENAKFKTLKEVAFPTDFSMLYNINILQPVVNITEKHGAAIRILNISKKDAVLNNDQNKNKELLEDYFSNLDHSFHFLTNKKVEDAVQCFVESRNIDMIVMVAKNLNYFQHILFHSKIEKISYHTDVPFLVLH
ncbi:nucleotide-binding universal stress UspA family protein [Gelidibacter algens]|uniref:Nucleotide-binding universal stress UspA family protein n=1 Tax=Gelidibacter algens TaxID=49280 RepID=A0A1A7R6Y3_9FLAO|nr:universal stress protein [Gelidibacter algens]OBX27229.1 universal stress protein [Gelidibacter algens]RAJ22090.1 nucleotide-binding universal stress UspA family protein [Gelidibacter algens]